MRVGQCADVSGIPNFRRLLFALDEPVDRV